MVLQQREENLIDDLAAVVQRPDLEISPEADDLNRRADGSDIPARISFRILIAGRKINPAMPVQVAKQVLQPLLKRALRRCAAYGDAARCRVLQQRHKSKEF